MKKTYIDKIRSNTSSSKLSIETDDEQSNNSERTLYPIINAKTMLQSMYARKHDNYIYQKVHPSDQEKFESNGWFVHREGSNTVRMKRIKSHDKLLEDQSWCLFYRMKYPEMNGENFRIIYKWPDGTVGEKQIDVFAKDDETVVIVECKSRENRGRRSLQKDLHETESLQKLIANAIRNHYGQSFKPKIIWLYITNNIIWSEPDLERANAINVRVVTENEMQYFDSFIKLFFYSSLIGRHCNLL